MKKHLIETPLAYTGEELRSHWAYSTLNIKGDCIIAFCGPCQVDLSEMVDLADVHQNAPIYSEEMLHLIIEHFQAPLESMVLRQRLLTAQIQDLLRKYGVNAQRSGDDLYINQKKLSVSIATVSPVSGLIHFGINISSANTPVPTRGLNDEKIPAREFAQEILNNYVQEEASMADARVKVRWVH